MELEADVFFYKRTRSSDGYRSICKMCSDAQTAEYRERNYEQLKEYRRKWMKEYRKKNRVQ